MAGDNNTFKMPTEVLKTRIEALDKEVEVQRQRIVELEAELETRKGDNQVDNATQ